tara:strand:+ start:167 stop:490 length:324 start_codon:yes stop_codon:yes gene_type:complete
MFKIESTRGEVWVDSEAVECLRSMGNGSLEVYVLCESNSPIVTTAPEAEVMAHLDPSKFVDVDGVKFRRDYVKLVSADYEGLSEVGLESSVVGIDLPPAEVVALLEA